MLSASDNYSDAPKGRADARRNRERILAAARAAFADPDADVSMVEVARRAGIGSATLYRNFANRRALLEALYTDEIDALCTATTTGVGEPATERLMDWLRRFYAYFISKRVVAEELLRHGSAEDPVFGAGYTRVIEAGRPLLEAARASGGAESELSLEQILDLIVAVAKVPGSESYRKPILETALAALRT